MSWIVKSFYDLTNKELHDILQARVNVFVVEQNCPYSEVDGKDIEALHLFKKEDETIIAYARILPPGVSYTQASIGRVLTNKKHRGKRLGYKLIEEALRVIQKEWKQTSIKIQAQSYLRSFYGSFGFIPVSEEYLEDNIPHIDMLLE